MWRRPGLSWVIVACAVFTTVYIALDLNKLHGLRYGVDEGTFLQMLVNFAHRGSTFDWPEARPHLQVHDSWTLLLLAPLVAARPYAETLIVIQCVAVAAAAVPLYIFARSFERSRGAATCIALAYLVSPSAQGWAFGNFIENMFVPVLGVSLALAVRRRSMVWTLVLAQLLMGLKEDEIWFLAWFGVLGAIWYDRRLGTIVALVALANGAAYYGYLHAVHATSAAPAYGIADRELPQQAAFFAEVMAPFAFAPLWLGWRMLLAAPLVAEITLYATWSMPMARAGTHYSAPIITLIAIGAVVAIARRPLLARYALVCALAMAAFFNVTDVHLGRYLYVPDDAGFTRARAVFGSGLPYTYTLAQEGAFVVAAGNVNARIDMRSPRPPLPAFNTIRPWWP